MEELKITTIEQLEEEVNKVYLLADKGIVRALCAAVIANRMDFKDAVWLLLVAPSSGGKTEMINGLGGLDFIFPISSLTVNTFASGMKVTGKETSMLHKINNKIMVFKDFTSILSINRDAKKEIMSQLREIYDGEYVKRTGNAKDTVWRGKVGAIAGSTEVIYEQLHEMSAMGDRFIMYNMDQPNRLDMAERMLENTYDMAAKREHIKACFKSYIEFVLNNLPHEDIILEKQTRRELLEVANFATLVRSAVMTDLRTGVITFVPSPEMPTRVTQQLYMIASAFVAMNKASSHGMKGPKSDNNYLGPDDIKILYKIAFDSIPKKRRWALQALAKYKQGVTTAGFATALGYESEQVKTWLYALNSLGVCKREKSGGRYGDKWILKDEYRDMMVRFDKVQVVDEVLEGQKNDDDDDFDAAFSAKEEEELANSMLPDEMIDL